MVTHRPFTRPVTPSTELPTRSESTYPQQDDVPKEQELIDFIQETIEDIRELESFYNITFSRIRVQRIGEYISERANEVTVRFGFAFDELSQQGKTDFLLMYNFVKRQNKRLQAEWRKLDELEPLFAGWATLLIELCEKRQKGVKVDGQDAAEVLTRASKSIDGLTRRITSGEFTLDGDKFAAYRGAKHIDEMVTHLEEWYGFHEGYDPLFTWWTNKPWQDLKPQLTNLAALLREKIVGITPDNNDAIVGQPIGRENILAEIDAEIIPYTPEQLIKLAEVEYKWCEREAIKAATEMGFGNDWRTAQDQVKNQYVAPGQQPTMVHNLAQEAITYVEKHNMITLPRISKECFRTFMMPPAAQKTNPFFLGGSSIIISYPTASMSHDDKLQVMRGNNPSFSRSTVFHELLPGHHLQYHYMRRRKPHRQLFSTPFWMEGWAFYWEMILWDRGFPGTPENRLGMLFWYMHRCARIVFSLRFHLGEWTPTECIEYLVDRVNHERATAEGEVRRSLNGDYGALYQAGYMLGALQIYALRKEVVEGEALMGEREFHDRVMRENMMPIELLRALLKGEKLDRGMKSRWKFYGDVDAQSIERVGVVS